MAHEHLLKAHIYLHTASGDTPILEYRRLRSHILKLVTSRRFQKWCSSGVVGAFLLCKTIDFTDFFRTFRDTAVAGKQDVGHGGFVSFPGCISPSDYTMARLGLTQSIFPKGGRGCGRRRVCAVHLDRPLARLTLLFQKSYLSCNTMFAHSRFTAFRTGQSAFCKSMIAFYILIHTRDKKSFTMRTLKITGLNVKHCARRYACYCH